MPGVSFASIRSRKVGLILAGALLCVLVAAGAIRSIRLQANRPTPELSTPGLAIETITARSLYYNAAARTWIAKDKPALLQKDDTGAGSPRARAFAQATQNRKLFRQLDRELRFDAL